MLELWYSPHDSGDVILPDLLTHTREAASGHWGRVVKALGSFLLSS